MCLLIFPAVCEILPAPENADLDCTDGNSFGSECEFVCNLGYTRVGVETFSCIETSQGVHWSHSIPICEPESKCRFAVSAKACFYLIIKLYFLSILTYSMLVRYSTYYWSDAHVCSQTCARFLVSYFTKQSFKN